ncbi:MAG: class I SAM-dependent methyltransferase [Acidimicrobiia bacterium]
MGDNWDDIASWWIGEATTDPAYATDVHPLFDHLLPSVEGRWVDLGCGEGQGMRRIDGTVVGVDLSIELAKVAHRTNPAVVAELPDLSCFAADSFGGAYSVYLVDLIGDLAGFFSEAARIVVEGGHLIIVINHPVYTALGSSPIIDADGEVLWRWGSYFDVGSSLEEGGGRSIRFFHRPLGSLLTIAAQSGWSLVGMDERALSADTIERLPGYEGQDHVPRLLGVHWRLSSASVSSL